MRSGGWRLLIATAAVALPAQGEAHDVRETIPEQLPPVTIVAPDAAPKLQQRLRRPARRERSARHLQPSRSAEPAASAANGISPAGAPLDSPGLQPRAASAETVTGEQVNAQPFSRVGEALEIVPGVDRHPAFRRRQSQPVF